MPLTSDLKFEQEAGSFTLKTASRASELESAIRLRSQVFRDDFGAASSPEDPLWDYDALDDRAEHLIIVDRASGRTVGTYRLIVSAGKERFYSQTEFDLTDFLAETRVRLELSRACVDPAFRGGAILALLWKGLSEVARRTKASVLFGCSSIQTGNPAGIQLLIDSLRDENRVEDRYGIRPLESYRARRGLSTDAEPPALSPLLRLYLKAGARIAPEPAHDRAFHCMDLLTILEIETMSDLMARRFGLR